MTSIYFDPSSNGYSTYPSDQHDEDQLFNHHVLNPNSQASSSSNSLTTHLFFSSNVPYQNGVFRSQLPPPQNQHEGDNLGSQACNDCLVENNHEKNIEFSTWKSEINLKNDHTQVKWMSSKMRVMLKMKKPYDPMKAKCEDDHSPPLMDQETDNSSSSNNTMPIRVCSDCNTTKTPLWRSGPRGPKSLCNACGIRQRKARRAMAAAAAAAIGSTIATTTTTHGSIDQPTMTPLKVTKTQNKDHKKPSNGHVTKYKKRPYTKQVSAAAAAMTTPSPPPSPARKNCVEEYLVSLSKNLTLYRVFPQDEKEAAILLMALSCGYAHE